MKILTTLLLTKQKQCVIVLVHELKCVRLNIQLHIDKCVRKVINFKTKARIKRLNMKLNEYLIPLLSKEVNSNYISTNL